MNIGKVTFEKSQALTHLLTVGLVPLCYWFENVHAEAGPDCKEEVFGFSI